MLDYLIFNKLKWFNVADNTDNVIANGKIYEAIPVSFTIKAGDTILDTLARANGGINTDQEVHCVGAGEDIYFFTGFINYNIGSNKYTIGQPGAVYKKDVKNIKWGVKPSLSACIKHLSHFFLPRRWLR